MKSRPWVILGSVVVAAVILQQFWKWEVERIDVQPGEFLVVTHLWGKDLPEGEILAPDASYKGIQLEVLPEGRHFLNPLIYMSERRRVTDVPVGQCAVLTRKYGTPISAERIARGDILAGPGERGIVPATLGPGRHRINPLAYDVELIPAVQITTEQVGIRTLKVGKEVAELKPQDRPSPYLVPDGYRGVQARTVPPGTYYINPFVESITPIDVRSHRVEFSDIEFPTKDGYNLKPYVLVTYRVLPEKAPELFVTLADDGEIHQADRTPEQQEKNQILQKVVLPLIRGYVRIEGSKFDAADFITEKADTEAGAANARERLQKELMEKVPPRCAKIGVIVESVTLAQLTPPEELAKQISDREQARVQRETIEQDIKKFQSEQDLQATKALKEQESAKVEANTSLLRQQTAAKNRLDTEEQRLKQELANAQLRLEAAKDTANKLLELGRAEADIIHKKNAAEVAGLKRAVEGFPSADAYAQYQMLVKIAPALGEIFASDTSEFAKLFSRYMTPPEAVRPTTAETVIATTSSKEPPAVPSTKSGPVKTPETAPAPAELPPANDPGLAIPAVSTPKTEPAGEPVAGTDKP